MAPRYVSDRVKLSLTLTVVLIFVISTSSTKHCTSKKTERDGYVIKNIGIKLCHLKCAEHGQCVSIEYDIETLTCRLIRDESKIEKEGHSHVPTDSCATSMCSFGQRCLKTRSGKEVCVQASPTDASEDVTPSKTVPTAPVTTQDSDPHATPSQANRNLYWASELGDLDRVKRILASGHVDINSRDSWTSMTSLMVATVRRRVDVVEFLVNKGADVSLVDDDGANVLHLACYAGELRIVKLILSLKLPDINVKDNAGETVADYARRTRRDHVLKLLASYGVH